MNASEAVATLISRGNVLLGVDFDGTLAPLVDHPDQAVPDHRALAHLRVLAAREGVSVVVVSGRAREDLELRLGDVPGVALVGEHGSDLGDQAEVDETIEEATRFALALRGDRDLAVEVKPRSVTFHTRSLGPDATREAVESLTKWADEHPKVNLLEGKEVVELTVATRTKGDAIAELGQGADGIVYIGDDVTDETVFAILGPGDVGVKVGPGPTSAPYRVSDVDGVVGVLEAAERASTR